MHWDSFNVKSGICYKCDNPTTNLVRVNTDGYVSTSSPVSVCVGCMVGKWNGDTHFVKIGVDLFWSINCDYGELNTLKPVNSREHYEWLKHKRAEVVVDKQLLTDVVFTKDRYKG